MPHLIAIEAGARGMPQAKMIMETSLLMKPPGRRFCDGPGGLSQPRGGAAALRAGGNAGNRAPAGPLIRSSRVVRALGSSWLALCGDDLAEGAIKTLAGVFPSIRTVTPGPRARTDEYQENVLP